MLKMSTIGWSVILVGFVFIYCKENEGNQMQSMIITIDKAKEIALEDARHVYKDLSVYNVSSEIIGDEIHIKFTNKNKALKSGGPFYIIERKTGIIKEKKYYQ